MKKLCSSLVVLIAMCTSAWAGQPVISFSGEVLKGGEGVLVVSIDCNGEEVRGFQCDIILPEGFEFTTFSDNKKFHMLEAGENMTVGGNNNSPRRRVLIYSADADPSNPNGGAFAIKKDGPVFEMAIKETSSDVVAGGSATGRVTGSDEPNGDPLISISCNPSSAGGGNQSFQQEDTKYSIVVWGAILDEESTTVCQAYDGPGVLVKRTIKAEKWNTICLPFAMDEAQVMAVFGENTEIADFKGITYKDGDKDLKVKFSRVTPSAFEANHPYIFKPGSKISEDIKRFAVMETVTIEPSSQNVKIEIDEDAFYGNYVVRTFTGARYDSHLYLSDNKFYYLKKDAPLEIKAFRGWIESEDKLYDYIRNNPSSANVNFFVDDDVIDGIDGITTNKVVEGVYDLQGRKVNDEHLKRGVYIINGKKVVVK